MLTKTLRTLTVAVALALGVSSLASVAGPNGISPAYGATCYGGPAAYGQANGPNAGLHGSAAAIATATVPLTADEAEDLTYMREEEKLARDIYLGFAELYAAEPFANVANSEQSHMDAMLRLLVKYGLPDPAAGMLIGEFVDPTLQALFIDLRAKGLASVLEALKVGGWIEEVDMVDLAEAIARATKPDLKQAYENLACGSRNHLRAFASNIAIATGVPYVAQYLPQEAVDAILAEPNERCGASQ